MSAFAPSHEPSLVNDVDTAIEIMREASRWLINNGKTPSKWWDSQNLNKEFLFQYAKPQEFFTLTMDNRPIAAVVLQIDQNAQDWIAIDGQKEVPAMYIHWLCVRREFAGRDIPRKVVESAAVIALRDGIGILRADTDADEANLCAVYESIGFELIGRAEEGYRRTAFYQKYIG
jgi:ribosomal protein S18 acetylase RimI-like enzyme